MRHAITNDNRMVMQIHIENIATNVYFVPRLVVRLKTQKDNIELPLATVAVLRRMLVVQNCDTNYC
ncbi:MAG: hypothetical protein AAGK47_05645 [Bacteroidota bacterium]